MAVVFITVVVVLRTARGVAGGVWSFLLDVAWVPGKIEQIFFLINTKMYLGLFSRGRQAVLG